MTDLEIEQAVTKSGGLWDGDHWKFEDADLHPFVRALLAAAPELLEALRHIEGVAMADEPRDLPGIAQTARAAIAMATGELPNANVTGLAPAQVVNHE